MDYHHDRFNDASLMVFKNDRLVACVAGNQVDQSFYSHQGITYGGIIFQQDAVSIITDIIDVIMQYLTARYHFIEWRWQPAIYNPIHDNMINYLNQLGCNTIIAYNNMHVNLNKELRFSSKKTAGYRNGKFDKFNLVVNHDFNSYWNLVLKPRLLDKYNSKPVHSLSEINLLASRFPDQIKQYLVYSDDKLLAGVTFFIKDTIVKSQYAAATVNGMKTRALEYLYVEAIRSFKHSGLQYLDFGHVNDRDGVINKGLKRFKEELGASSQLMYRSQWQISSLPL